MLRAAPVKRLVPRRLPALCLLALLIGILGSAGVARANETFLVPTGASEGGFGAFADAFDANTAADAKAAFGAPSSAKRRTRYVGCDLRWSSLGIKATFTTYGLIEGDPCEVGIFIGARLTDRRWYTATGLRVGVSEKKVRRYSKRTCTKQTCGTSGCALGLRETECSGSFKVPTVIAVVRERRLAAFMVNPRSCE